MNVTSLKVTKRYKAEEAEKCFCCGRAITKVEVLETGDKVGSECAGLIEFPAYRFGRTLTKKQAAFFANNGLDMPVNQISREDGLRNSLRNE